jgi:endoglucanase
MNQFYQAHKSQIIAPDGKQVFLRGVNLGGWLMMEGYIMHALNLPVKNFKKAFAAKLGAPALADFEKNFNDTFIQEDDFKFIAQSGFNFVRLPFHYGLIEQAPGKFDRKGVAYLDRAISWAAKYDLTVLLDMHAVPGCQNGDWHSDSEGKADFWRSAASQRRAIAIWEYLADRYKDNGTVVGYDLLNEAVIDDPKPLSAYYKKAIKAIRAVDRHHILFVEGNRWAQDLDVLDEFEDNNLVFSIHYYEPMEYTFNLIPHLSYPLTYGFSRWDMPQMRKRLEGYARFAQKKQRALHVGEFGVNYRQSVYGEDVYLRDILACFKDLGLHWNYWTYKAVKNAAFPDGIYSYYPNSPWVNRQGPKLGWDTYAAHWPAKKKEMIESWKTKEFVLNTKVFEVLKNGV